MAFDVVDVSAWPVVSQEPGGAEEKVWLTPPSDVGEPNLDHLWLFKRVKVGKTSGYRRYDDLAERIACALADVIELPHADVELAVRREPGEANSALQDGVVSRSVIPRHWEMHNGDTILDACPGYRSCADVTGQTKNRPGHNLTNIAQVLSDYLGPPGHCRDWRAFDVFAGYLVFDAWIGNNDRHALNWAVLHGPFSWHLAPSFDHGTALAEGIPDERLSDHPPTAYAAGGMAKRFESGARQPLVDLARNAVGMAGPRARQWVDRIVGVSPTKLDEILDEAVTMSDPRRTFLGELLRINQRRLEP